MHLLPDYLSKTNIKALPDRRFMRGEQTLRIYKVRPSSARLDASMGLLSATGVHDIKQKGRSNPLKNQGLRPIVPAAKQRKETGLSQKSGILVPSGRLVPAASMPATPRGLGISGKRKGPEIFRAFLYGGGVRTRVQFRSPRP
jgi:hypothetical protein